MLFDVHFRLHTVKLVVLLVSLCSLNEGEVVRYVFKLQDTRRQQWSAVLGHVTAEQCASRLISWSHKNTFPTHLEIKAQAFLEDLHFPTAFHGSSKLKSHFKEKWWNSSHFNQTLKIRLCTVQGNTAGCHTQNDSQPLPHQMSGHLQANIWTFRKSQKHCRDFLSQPSSAIRIICDGNRRVK